MTINDCKKKRSTKRGVPVYIVRERTRVHARAAVAAASGRTEPGKTRKHRRTENMRAVNNTLREIILLERRPPLTPRVTNNSAPTAPPSFYQASASFFFLERIFAYWKINFFLFFWSKILIIKPTVIHLKIETTIITANRNQSSE